MSVSFDNVPRSAVGWDVVRNTVLNQLYCETLALSDISDICDVINDESMRISSTRTSAQQLLDSTMCSVRTIRAFEEWHVHNLLYSISIS